MMMMRIYSGEEERLLQVESQCMTARHSRAKKTQLEHLYMCL